MGTRFEPIEEVVKLFRRMVVRALHEIHDDSSALLRSAIGDNAGREVKSLGDGQP